MRRDIKDAKRWLSKAACLFCVFLLESGTGFAADRASVSGKTDYIFAISWQPGFCETRPTRNECKDQTAERYDATHFSLHGLWQMKKSYCGVSADMRSRDRKSSWLDLPQLALSGDTATQLPIAMPGTKSGLDRHQWLRSGTCQGGTAQTYFSLQLTLLDDINASAVRDLFAGRIGGEVSESEVKQAFDASFGAGAGDRVRMRCQKDDARLVITGLTIGLTGEMTAGKGLSPLILAAGPTDFKCARGVVDGAGFQ